MCSGHAVHMKVRHVTGASEAQAHKGEFITGKLQQGANVQYQELHQGKTNEKINILKTITSLFTNALGASQ